VPTVTSVIRQESAERLYLRALSLEPKSPIALCSLASIRYAVSQDFDSAVELYEGALAVDPQHVPTLCNYGMLYYQHLVSFTCIVGLFYLYSRSLYLYSRSLCTACCAINMFRTVQNRERERER
jgi:tetratricopeptide (TPR) repeat protein